MPLVSLKKLYLAQNRISDLGPLSKLKGLEVLHLRENEIVNLTGLDDLTELRELNLRSNQIAEINEFDHLTSATKLFRFFRMIWTFFSLFDNSLTFVFQTINVRQSGI